MDYMLVNVDAKRVKVDFTTSSVEKRRVDAKLLRDHGFKCDFEDFSSLLACKL
jgi:hypothetical protein